MQNTDFIMPSLSLTLMETKVYKRSSGSETRFLPKHRRRQNKSTDKLRCRECRYEIYEKLWTIRTF